MFRLAIVATLLVMAPYVAAAADPDPQPAVPLASLKLDLDALKSWNTKRYKFEGIEPGQQKPTLFGEFVMKTTVEQDRILLEDVSEAKEGRNVYKGRTVFECRKDNFLRPLRITADGEGRDVPNFTAEVDGTAATIRSKGKVLTKEIPVETLSVPALFRLITLVPRTTGTRIVYGYWLEPEEQGPHIKKHGLIESLGSEAVDRKGEQIACTKFRVTNGGTHPLLCWISNEGLLIQILIDGRNRAVLEPDVPANPSDTSK